MPSTKPAAFSARVIESSWLVALVTVPLLFNVNSNNSFELDKVALVRALAWIVGMFWLIHRLENVPMGSREHRSSPHALRPWVLLAVSFFAVHALATALSVAPRTSVLGSSTRWQGLYTLAAYLVLHCMVLEFLRRREQLERLIDAALVASLPVALYGIVQHFGTDPVPWATDSSERVASTLGNPIFVSAFLILVVPFTIYRHVDAGRGILAGEGRGLKSVMLIGGLLSVVLQIAAWRLGPMSGTLGALVTLALWSMEARLLDKPRLPFVRLAACNVLLSVQLACLLLAQSRGPWLGLITGLLFLALAWALTQRAWLWARSITLVGVVVVVALVALNVPGTPLAAAEDLPYVHRLTRMTGSTGQVRLIIWDAAAKLTLSDSLRALVGYGPETQRLVLGPHVPAELGQVELRGALPDRAHNETLDLLVTTGALGVGVHLLWLTALLACGLGGVGLVGRGRERRIFIGACVGGALSLAVLTRLVQGSWRLGGPALALGVIAGSFAYLVVRAFRGPRNTPAPKQTAGPEPNLVVIVLLAAIVAHTVELQFGIAVTASRLYFFVYAASLAVAARRFARSPAPKEPSAGTVPSYDSGAPRFRELAVKSLLVGLALATLGYDFHFGRGAPAELLSIPWLFAFTWLVGGILSSTGAHESHGERGHIVRSFAIFTAISLAAVLAFAGWHLVWLTAHDVMEVATSFLVFVLVLVLALGLAMLGADRTTSVLARRWALPVYVVLSSVAVAVGLGPTLDAVRADVDFKRARLASLAGRSAEALHFAGRAIERQPARDAYHDELGRLLMQKGLRATTPEARELSFAGAERSYRTARALMPLDPDYPANLSRLFAAWAQTANDAETRRTHLERALRFSTEALARHPENVRLWNERGAILFLTEQPERALEAYRTSLELDDRFAETHLHVGDLWRARGELEAAAAAYEDAAARSPRSASIAALHRLAAVFATQGRIDDAIGVNQRILRSDPRDAAAHGNLASLFSLAGEWDLALAHAERAIETAAPRDKAAFEDLRARLRERSNASRE